MLTRHILLRRAARRFHCKRKMAFSLLLAIISVTLLSMGGTADSSRMRPGSQPFETKHTQGLSKAEALKAYGKMPLAFEANRGQHHEQVRYSARGGGYSIYLTSMAEMVLALRSVDKRGVKRNERSAFESEARSEALRLKFAGANPTPRIECTRELTGRVNYFIGDDSRKWRTDVPTYAGVKYRDVYPGIDLLYYGDQRGLEYDLIVAPGADPGRIAMRVEGAAGLKLDHDGNLMLKMAGGAVALNRPVIYQEIDGARRQVQGRYVLKSAYQVGFQLGDYDKGRPLIIDPVVLYSTYIAGTGTFEQSYGIAVDSGGNAYVTGETVSINLPPTAGAYHTNLSGPSDAFVIKINSAGTGTVYSTYLGGNGIDQGYAIAIDGAGNAYITGKTDGGYPTLSAYQNVYAGGQADAFVTKLNATGNQLLYSTYLGGGGQDLGLGIAVNGAGHACVTGHTDSNNFKVTAGAYQPALGAPGFGSSDLFVAKLDITGNAIYATYFGGQGYEWGRAVAIDGPGNVYVTGDTASLNFKTTAGAFDNTFNGGTSDAFMTKFSPGGTPDYSTFLGGGGFDQGFGIAIDIAGNAYVTGATTSANFPSTANASQPASGGGEDAFVLKLYPTAGAPLLYSTYLGGNNTDRAAAIAVDNAGNAYVTGRTLSSNFPLLNPTQSGAAGAYECFMTIMDSTSSRLFSTYLGGSNSEWGNGIAVDGPGNIYVTGRTDSSQNFPLLNPLQSGYGNGFVIKYGPKSACVDPPNTTMVAWYPFDEASGTTAANLATGNAGAHMGGPLIIPGKVGNALRFDGVNDSVESPSTIVTNIGPAGLPPVCSGLYSTCRGDFSIDAWVRMPPSSYNMIMPLVEKKVVSGTTWIGYGFWIALGKLGLQLADAGAGIGTTSYLSTPIPNLYNNQWHHVAVTVSRRTASGISWYFDGVLISTSDPTIAPTRYGSLINNAPLRIGTTIPSSSGSLWFKGDVDELEIFNRELTQGEVKAIFTAGPAGKCK